DRVRVSNELGEGKCHRILILDPDQRPLQEVTRGLSDLGYLVARGTSPDRLAFLKRIRSAGQERDVSVTDTPTSPTAGGGPKPTTWGRLLIRDLLLEHAWEGRHVG